MTPPKTTRVRILVAVDKQGGWVSHGHSSGDDDEAMDWIAVHDLIDPITYHWLEADIPLPEIAVVEGRVVG